MKTNFTVLTSLLCLMFLLVPPSLYADTTFRVGVPGTPQCTHNELSDALSDASLTEKTFIQVAANDITPYTMVIANREVEIRGGFIGCSGAHQGTQSRSLVSPAGNGSAFLAVNTDDQIAKTVTLKNMTISGGNSITEGGGLKVVGNAGFMTVKLIDSIIESNTATLRGGGVYVEGEKATLTINNSVIRDNQSLQGGGLACQDGSIVFSSGEISGNRAERDEREISPVGGGVFLSSCQWSTQSDGRERRIINNTSRHLYRNWHDAFAGGMYIVQSQVVLGSANSLTIIEGNEAIHPGTDMASSPDRAKQGRSRGGGLYISGPSTNVSLLNVQIVDNRAIQGGGIYLRDGRLNINASASCTTSEDYPFCSSLALNFADGYGIDDCNINGGAQYIYGGQGGAIFHLAGELTINATAIYQNKADRDAGALLCLRDVLVRDSNGTALFIGGQAIVTNSFFAFNDGALADEVVRVQDEGNLVLNHTTFYGNNRGGVFSSNGHVNTEIRTGGDGPRVSVYNSIFDDNDESIAVYRKDGALNETAEFDCVRADSDSAINTNATTVGRLTTNPQSFADPDNLDFHLTDTHDTGAVDFCTTELETTATVRDFDAKFRPDNHPAINNGGTVDLGAYEFLTENFEPILDITPELSITPQLVASGAPISFTMSIKNTGIHAAIVPKFKLELAADGVLEVVSPGFNLYWTCSKSTEPGKIFFDCSYKNSIAGNGATVPMVIQAIAAGANGNRFFTKMSVTTASVEQGPNNNTVFKYYDIGSDLIFQSSFE